MAVALAVGTWSCAAAILGCSPLGGTAPGSGEYTIAASAGPNGNVSPSGSLSVAAGAGATFTFTPDAGFVVEAVTVDGALQASIPVYVFSNVRSDHELHVTFKPIGPLVPQVLAYLKRIGGSLTLSGQHNKEPSSAPAAATERVFQITGKYPALWSGDFLFVQGSVEPANRWTMAYEAKRQWDEGAVVHLMWHACPPTQPEPCNWEGGVKSTLTEGQWNDLVTGGGALNRAWKEQLDEVTPYLRYLEDNGVEVLWRPLHEMNQRAFWWGGRPGADGTARLYRITHDYLTEVKGLRNLIWVWDIQDFWSDAGSVAAIAADIEPYNPGDRYWDIVALDPYSTGYAQENHEALRAVAHGKPMAIGECERLPDAVTLRVQRHWLFFMLWPDFVTENAARLPAVYAAPNVLTRDEMPGW